MRRCRIRRNMDKLYVVLAYFQKSRFQNEIESDSHHPACIAIMIATNTNFMTFKLRTNGMKMLDITKSEVAKKKDLIICINTLIPIVNEAFIHLLNRRIRTTSILDDIFV